jgi:hypothetical protein
VSSIAVDTTSRPLLSCRGRATAAAATSEAPPARMAAKGDEKSTANAAYTWKAGRLHTSTAISAAGPEGNPERMSAPVQKNSEHRDSYDGDNAEEAEIVDRARRREEPGVEQSEERTPCTAPASKMLRPAWGSG